MKSAIIVDEGFEDIVATSLQNYDITDLEIQPTIIKFTHESILDLAKLAYTCQSTIKIILDVEEFNTPENFEETTSNVLKTIPNIEKAIKKCNEGPVKVSCVRKGDHHFRSVDVSAEFSKNLAFETTLRGQLTDVIIYIKDEKGYVGIDFTGRVLNKRDYKIFNGANTLRGSIAHNLSLIADAKPEDLILDPFMGSGTIPIELALQFTRKSPYFFSKEKFAFTKTFNEDWDSFFKQLDEQINSHEYEIYAYDSMLKFLKNTQKNAKIADINKSLKLSKVSLDWIDTKFEENSIDKIITHPPYLTEHGSKTKILKIYKELFSQASLLLKIEGTITIITNPNSAEYLKNVATEKEFNCSLELDVYEGKQDMTILKFQK